MPHKLQYLRDLYQTPALKSTVNWEHIKLALVYHGIEEPTAGPSFDYEASHDRASRFAS